MQTYTANETLGISITTLLLGVLITFGTLITLKKKEPKTDLEVYTKNNIYYINGLTVTNEVSSDTIVFDNQESLKVFISDVSSGVLEYHY